MNNKCACGAASLLLIVMIAAIALNSLYVRNTAENISSALDTLPLDPKEASSAIRATAEYWSRRRTVLDLSIPKPELDAITSLLDELTVSAEEGNDEEFKKAMARLRRAIEDIGKLEGFSTENIF